VRYAAFTLVWLLLAAPGFAGSTPQPVPADGVITAPGVYVLDADRVVDRHPAIVVEADDVTLDLGGHALRYTGEAKAGVFGVVVNGRSNVRITNGAIGGFWFNVHATGTTALCVDHVDFDDIIYIAVNAAKADRLVVEDCTFTNFRYDVPKTGKETYIIAINTGATDGLIARNTFDAQYTAGDPSTAGMETVFVLFSAKVSQRSVVAHNRMAANVPVNRSYGVWIATGAQVSLLHNTIHNMHHGVTLAGDAEAVIAFNTITVDGPPAGSAALATDGVAATGARRVTLTDNRIEGQTQPVALPREAEAQPQPRERLGFQGDTSRSSLDYQTVTPRVGNAFEVLPGFEAIEPTLAGTDQPLPGWVGAGHVIVLRDGRLLIAYAHENRCRVAFSADGGRTWTAPVAAHGPLPDEAKTARPAVIERANGELWLFLYGWIKYDVPNPDASINNLWAVRSADGGATWSEPRLIYEGYVGMMQGAIETSAGHLVVPICDYTGVRHFVARCVVSADGGESWRATDPLDVGEPETTLPLSANLSRGSIEPTIAELPDGRLLMLVRTVVGVFYQSESSDGGLTWSELKPSPLTCGGPGNMVTLPSGRVAFAYNPANPDSTDAAKWGSPIGYDRQTLALLDRDGRTWRITHDFVRQIEGQTRVVHSTITGLGDGTLLVTMPNRSTLLRVAESRLLDGSP